MATVAKLYPILKHMGLDDLKANEFVEIIDQSRKEGLATREDIKDLEIRFREDIKDLEIRFKEDIKDLEIRLVKWIIGLMIAQTSITIALLKLF